MVFKERPVPCEEDPGVAPSVKPISAPQVLQKEQIRLLGYILGVVFPVEVLVMVLIRVLG